MELNSSSRLIDQYKTSVKSLTVDILDVDESIILVRFPDWEKALNSDQSWKGIPRPVLRIEIRVAHGDFIFGCQQAVKSSDLEAIGPDILRIALRAQLLFLRKAIAGRI